MEVNADNYYVGTRATWTTLAVNKKAASQWAEMCATFGVDYSSPNGSHYIMVNDTVYRYSNHWGVVGSCSWHLAAPLPKWLLNTHIIACCCLQDFKFKPHENINFQDNLCL